MKKHSDRNDKMTIKYRLAALVLLQMAVGFSFVLSAQSRKEKIHSQWEGKKVAFLGDSMTDKNRIGTTCVYWEYLAQLMGIKPLVYGVNGAQWNDLGSQCLNLRKEHEKDVDAIIVFSGTNDYNAGVPIGEFFREERKNTDCNGHLVERKHREFIMTDSTFCGRINSVLSFLKRNFPTRQIILMTPIHRAYASFSANNIQPDENYCNACGLYIEDYVNVLKRAGSVWSVPVIDLFSLSGLFPLYKEGTVYFHDASNDRLHPNAKGDNRLAKTIEYQLLALPSSFGN